MFALLGSIVWHAFVSLLLDDFIQANHSIGEFILVYPCTKTILTLCECSQPEETSSWACFLMTSLRFVTYSLCGKLDHNFTLTGWQAIQIATMPWIVPIRLGASQVKTCKTESVISLQSGKRTQLKYSCEMDGVLLKVHNRKGRCYAWILEATTKSPLNLELLLFLRYNRCNHCLIHAVFQHILAIGTNSLAPTCLSSGWLCIWHRCVMSHP
jgi:hypothetical protein